MVLDNRKNSVKGLPNFYFKQSWYFFYEDIADKFHLDGIPILPEQMPYNMNSCIHMDKSSIKFNDFFYYGEDLFGNLLYTSEPGEQERTSKEVSLCIIL